MNDEKNETLRNDDIMGENTIQQGSQPKQKRSKKKLGIILGVVAAVLIVAGVGFYVWHEQPSFCNAICHQPMDPYVESYYGGDDALMVTAHSESDVTCLECHVPTIAEQISEGLHWVSGDYTVPLESIHYSEGFCLNENCHNMTRDELTAVYIDEKRNPHNKAAHGEVACESCHYSHTESVMYCSQCHDDAFVPEGWLTAQEAAEAGIGNYVDVLPDVEAA